MSSTQQQILKLDVCIQCGPDVELRINNQYLHLNDNEESIDVEKLRRGILDYYKYTTLFNEKMEPTMMSINAQFINDNVLVKEKEEDKPFLRDYLSASEVLQILGITRVTLSHWVKSGKIKAIKLDDKLRYVYDKQSIYSLKVKG